MSSQEHAPARVEYPSSRFAGLVAELQVAIVELSLAVGAHLAELRRTPPEGTHHREAHRLGLAHTARALEAANAALNSVFAEMRQETRDFGRLIRSAETRISEN